MKPEDIVQQAFRDEISQHGCRHSGQAYQKIKRRLPFQSLFEILRSGFFADFLIISVKKNQKSGCHQYGKLDI